jgi:hypothetical protein
MRVRLLLLFPMVMRRVGLVIVVGLLAQTTDLSAQVTIPRDRQIPNVRVGRPLEKRSEVQRTLVAFDPSTGSWTSVSKGGVVSSSDQEGTPPSKRTPAQLIEKLEEFIRQGRRIDAIEFTPTGGWTLVAQDLNWTRGVDGEYYDVLKTLAGQGRSIQAIAFNPVEWARDRGFVIVHDRGFDGRSIPAEMRSKLEEFQREGRKIEIVEFTPTGGWTIIAREATWTRGVGEGDHDFARAIDPAMQGRDSGTPTSPMSYFERLQSLGQEARFVPHAVAFDPDNYATGAGLYGYVIVLENSFFSQNVQPRLAQFLKESGGLHASYVKASRSSESVQEQPIVGVTKTAVIELQELHVGKTRERAGDEPYIVVYPLRGRMGVRDRILVFDTDRQIELIRTENNWAHEGGVYDIPARAGRIRFDDLQPFEVYGIVLLVAERNHTSQEDRVGAVGTGKFRDDVGIFNLVADRFNRALPFDAPRPDNDDLSESNVRRRVYDAFNRIGRHFDGDLRHQAHEIFSGLPDAFRESDDLFEFIAYFFINAPALRDWEVADIANRVLWEVGTDRPNYQGDFRPAWLQPGIFHDMVFRESYYEYQLRGEHRLYDSEAEE